MTTTTTMITNRNNSVRSASLFRFFFFFFFLVLFRASTVVSAQHLREAEEEEMQKDRRGDSWNHWITRFKDFFNNRNDQDEEGAAEEGPPTPMPSPSPRTTNGAAAAAADEIVVDVLGLDEIDDVPIAPHGRISGGNGGGGGKDYDTLDDGEKDIIITPAELHRVVIDCPEDMTHEECVDEVRSVLSAVCDSGGGGGSSSAKMLHELPTAHAVAASIRGSDAAAALAKAIEELPGFDAEEDRDREPLYLRDSVRVLTEAEIERGDAIIYEASIGDHHHQQHGRHLQTVGGSELTYGLAIINAREAWSEFGTAGAGATVCVIDSGLHAAHPDLERSSIDGYSGGDAVSRWNADASGHGTHVSGTIAAQPNGSGVAGVAPGADLYVVRVFSDTGRFFGSDIVAAGEACVRANAHIISMSLGGPYSSNAEQRFFNNLQQRNIMAIAASGNDGDEQNLRGYPAAYANVMSVAAVDRFGNVATFSTHNEFVDIAGPGVQVRSTWNNGGYATISGTSMAAPHVSGVAALLKAYRPSATVAEISNAMLSSARDRGATGRDEFYGAGIVDALAALRYLSGSGGSSPVPPPAEAPVRPPAAAPASAPTPQGSCVETTVLVITDNYGRENSFSLRDAGDDTIIFIERTLASNTRYSRAACLMPSGCYRFAILDTYGDGISGSGRGAQIRFGTEVVYSRRSFGSGEIFYFGGGCS